MTIVHVKGQSAASCGICEQPCRDVYEVDDDYDGLSPFCSELCAQSAIENVQEAASLHASEVAYGNGDR